ncbi:MAG TPA: O-antigen ligase family protein [Burkholderiales bacterium]|nr:O-antigen ligase family protein [Burkholderiales bacterium]
MLKITINSWFLLLIAFLTGLAIPVSTSLQNITVALICIIALVDPNLRKNILLYRKNYFVIFSVLLYFVFLAWIYRSQASRQDINHMLIKMRILILCPLIFAYFSQAKYRVWACIGFMVGCIITFIISFAICILKKPILYATDGDWAVFHYHTYHNYFLAVLVVGLISLLLYYYKQISLTKIRWIYAIIIFSTIDILYFVQGRAGQVLFVLMVMAIILLWNIRKGLWGIILISILLPAIIYTSPAIKKGLSKFENDINEYNVGHSMTSVGLRIEYHEYSRKMIMQSPIWGYGTGSFQSEYHKFTGFVGDECPRHPHNDFYWLWIELGFLGPLLLSLITMSACYYGLKAKTPEGKLALVIALSYVVGALQGGFYTDNISSSAFMVMLGILLSGSTLEEIITYNFPKVV